MLITNTIFIGKVLINLPEVDSTNDYLQQLMRQGGLVEGTVITAAFQTSGKGQRNNGWESETGRNLLSSFLLTPNFLPVRHSFFLTMISSLAVRKTIQNFTSKKVSIKWPNDIWVSEKKIAGILIQNSISQSSIQSCIMGIGLNVNQKKFGSPNINATSLSLLEEMDFSIEKVLSYLCQNLEKRYLELKSGKVEKIKEDYLSVLLGLGEKRRFLLTETQATFSGEIRGVNADGQLAVLVENTINYYENKEVVMIPGYSEV